MGAKDLYEQDFFEWTARNAELLRDGRFGEADIGHIAEEIEDMGKRDSRELGSRLAVLLEHLLKWRVQPGLRGSSWRRTILVQRSEISKLLKQAPSLRRKAELPAAYKTAVKMAVAETGLPASRFPRGCPFTIEQLLDEDFFPE